MIRPGTSTEVCGGLGVVPYMVAGYKLLTHGGFNIAEGRETEAERPMLEPWLHKPVPAVCRAGLRETLLKCR